MKLLIDIVEIRPSIFGNILMQLILGLFHIITTCTEAVFNSSVAEREVEKANKENIPLTNELKAKILTQNLFQNMLDLRDISLELLMSLIESFKKKLKNNQPFIQAFMNNIISMMIKIIDDNDWFNNDDVC